MIFGDVDISDALLDEMKDRALGALGQRGCTVELQRHPRNDFYGAPVSIGVFTRIRLLTLTSRKRFR